jgi:tetratricopeptide (TPR) repeat protein
MLARDPLWFPARLNLGGLLQEEGDFAGAIREQQKVLEQAPNNIFGIEKLAKAHMAAGDLKSARALLETWREKYSSNFRFRTAWALLLLLEGRTAEARREVDAELEKWLAADVLETLMAAEFYATLGEEEKALEWLERTVRNGNERVEWLRKNPLLANIRNEPRFKQILESIAFRRRQRQATQPAK